jgi:hypothetical protein
MRGAVFGPVSAPAFVAISVLELFPNGYGGLLTLFRS